MGKVTVNNIGTDTTPPDGGWGWVVVVVLFCNFFLATGFLYVSGNFIDVFVEVSHQQLF